MKFKTTSQKKRISLRRINSYIVQDSAEIVENGRHGVHASAVVLDERHLADVDEVRIQRTSKRLQTVQGIVGQQVNAVAKKKFIFSSFLKRVDKLK